MLAVPQTQGEVAPHPIKVNEVLEVYGRLLSWDLSIPKKYMVGKGLYTAGEIDRVEIEYKRFLAMGTVLRNIPISRKLDDFWHTHIIFTQDYTMMCSHVLGFYLHHRPAILDGGAQLTEEFKSRTLLLYEENFGEPETHYWDIVVCKCCGPDGCCID